MKILCTSVISCWRLFCQLSASLASRYESSQCLTKTLHIVVNQEKRSETRTVHIVGFLEIFNYIVPLFGIDGYFDHVPYRNTFYHFWKSRGCYKTRLVTNQELLFIEICFYLRNYDLCCVNKQDFLLIKMCSCSKLVINPFGLQVANHIWIWDMYSIVNHWTTYNYGKEHT